MALAGNAPTAPTGGHIVSGTGGITHVGNTTVIKQASPVLSIDWQSFDIGAGHTVDFQQPGADSLAVNRVLGNSASRIFGHLHANGQVWLINPNGVLFGDSARVNVAGLVASTLEPHRDGSNSGSVVFSGDGAGSIVNQGSIVTAAGGYAALIGNRVSNEGVIRAQLGSIALAGGNQVTLTFADHHLMHLQVNRSTIRSLVENHQLLVADGGEVLMTAGARDSLVASVVNNTGTVRARSVVDHDGTITLLAGMQTGTVTVGGMLDASAPDGGNGGKIETSGAHLGLAPGAAVTANASHGRGGTWLVDPVDLTIDTTAAGVISSTLEAGTNVTEQTTAGGASGQGSQSAGQGDIDVNAGISWSSPATLTLDAYHDINVNAGVAGTGGIVMHANGSLDIGAAGSLSAGTNASLQAGKFVNHAGASALGNHWTLYTTTPSQNTLGGVTPAFIQYNATPADSLAATGNALVYSAAPTLTISALQGTVSKAYDATTDASFAGSNFTTSGLLNGDVVDSAAHGTYASANVGSSIAVSAPSTIADFSISNGGVPVYGYSLGVALASAAIGEITPKQLTAKIVGDPTKVYDGTDTATLTSANYEIDGFVAGQGGSVGQPSSVAYDGVDAGAHTVNATFSVTNFAANAGTRFSNYVLPVTASGAGTISKAPLILTGLFANDKTYDGNANAVIDTGSAALYGVIAPDSGKVALDKSGITGTFAQVDAGNDINVAVSGYGLTGTEAHNYEIETPANLSADIGRRSLTISQVTAASKGYDGTAAATLDTHDAALGNVVGSDDVDLQTASAKGVFSQADVGSGLAVTTSGFSLGGAKAGDYTLVQPTLNGDISPAPLTISMTGTPEKTYDGTDAVALHAGNFSISGFVGTQHAVVNQSTAHFATANAGDDISVTDILQPSDFKPDPGTSLSNYTFDKTIVGNGIGKIDPLQLQGRIINNPTKVYDGTTAAQLADSNLELLGFVPGDSIAADFAGTVAGTYDSEHAGARKVVSGAIDATHFTPAAGTLLSNYALPVSYDGSGTITPAPLGGKPSLSGGIGAVAGATAVSKVYDGTDTVTLHGDNFTLSGWVGGDGGHVDNAASITGYFGQSDVGTNLALSATLGMADIAPNAGTDLNDYQLIPTAIGVGDITPRTLAVAITNDPTKVYNGSVDALLASGNFSISGFAPGEGGSIVPTATASYDSADAGTRSITTTLTPGNYQFDAGTKAYNYTLAYSASGAGTILKAPLVITNVYATDKVYDTTTSDSLNTASAGLSGLVRGDATDVALDLSGVVANFSQSNAGTGIGVAASGFAITGSKAANYDLQAVTGLTADIKPAPLALVGVLADDKTYDGNKDATLDLTGATLSGVLGSDNVAFDDSAASAAFRTAHAGNGINVNVGGIALSGSAAGNYQLAQPTGLTASIDPKPLTAVIIGNPEKVYDGTNSATLYASDYQLKGFVGSDSATIPQSATANYLTKDAGTNLGVASTLVASDFLAAAGTDLSNYVLPTTGSGTRGQIDPKVLDLSGTRIYDGAADTAAAHDTFGGGVVQGVNGETLALTGTYGSLSSGNAGNYSWSNDGTGGLALADGTLGGLASNYTLVGGQDTYKISKRPLTDAISAADKDYDGTVDATLTSATLQSDNGSGQGLIAGDDVSLVDPTHGTFASKNVGTWTVTSDGVTGAAASNYVFTAGTTSAAIAKNLGNVLKISIEDVVRQYDGTTTVSSGVPVLLSGTLMGGDKLNHDGTYQFLDPNVGIGDKEVSVAGVTVDDGNGGGNYTVQYVDNTGSTIDPALLTVTAKAASKVYDGNAYSGGNGVSYSGFVHGETTAVLDTSGLAYSGSSQGAVDAGSYVITPAGLAADHGNYTIAYHNGALTVARKALDLGGSRDYDGTVNADAGVLTLTGLVGSETLNLSGSGSVASRNVGSYNEASGSAGGTHFALGTLTLADGSGGGKASNYTLVGGADSFTISPSLLKISTDDVTKTYDGTLTANGTPIVVGGQLFGSDSLSGGDYAFDDPNVGTSDKTVHVANVTVGDGNGGGNYTVQYVDNTGSTIDPALLTVTAKAASKVYDGNAYSGGNGVSYSGFVHGETTAVLDTSGLAYSGSSQGAVDAGSYVITPAGLAADHGNYTIAYHNGALTVARKALDLGGSRDYDGTVNADAGVLTLTGLVGSETLNLSGSGSVASRNVGSYNEASGSAGGTHFALGTLTLADGSGGGKASNYTLVGGADSFTINAADLWATAKNASKTYDGTAYAGGNGLVYSGFVNGEDASVLDTTGLTYTGSSQGAVNAGSYVITPGGVSADDGNYTIHYADGTLAIDRAAVTLTADDVTKTYGDTLAFTGSEFVASGLQHGETIGSVSLASAGSGATADVAGSPYDIVASHASGGTFDPGNYTITYKRGKLTVDPLAITVSALGTDKVYDGNTDDVATLATSGLINGDSVVFTGSAQFLDPNAGMGKPVQVTGIASSDADAANYTFNTTASTTADVTPRVLDLSGTRMYDGTTAASANVFGQDGMLTGVGGDKLLLHGSGQTASKDTGTYDGANFQLGTLFLTGGGSARAGNYTLLDGSDVLVIDKAPATVIADSAAVDYNGRRQTVTGFSVEGLVGGDDKSALGGLADAGGSGRDAGSYVHSITGSARNYDLTFVDGTLRIKPLAISVVATGINKFYDATTRDDVTLHSGGVLAADAVDFTYQAANFSDSAIGDGKTVTVTGIRLGGSGAGNYLLADPSVTTTANIIGAQPSFYGVGNGLLAEVHGATDQRGIATPYGLAPRDPVGVHAGNDKRRHHVVERNRSRADFTSGMALKVIDGGVRLPGHTP